MARIVTDGTAYVNLSQVDTVATQKLGQSVQADSGIYEYFQANGAVAEGAACIVSYDDGQAVEATTTLSGSTAKAIGVACEALADNEYGWFWRGKGYENVLVATGVSAAGGLFTSATDGVLGANGGSDDAVIGTISAANASGGTLLTAVSGATILATNT